MRVFPTGLISIFAFVFISLAIPIAPVWSDSADLQSSISRLKNNPHYRGKVLSTHIRELDNRSIFEVRILKKNDRIVIVYIDPETGGVIGDSLEGSGKRKKNKKKRR
ncbi:MAG: PepSY domain-containing protein [Sneathiellales bacterium]|nr:PepSY domain-containing protein [Sneathiellales bacterium]